MATPPTLFFDIGGVLLTNAWDTPIRTRAVERFGLDNNEFQTRHGMLKTAFETGQINLDTYVNKTVFHRSRMFSPDEFKSYMFSQSQALPEALDWVRKLAATGKYQLFSLNNESRELHQYRVRTFDLGSIFQAFLTSCYIGHAKPDEATYLNALGVCNCGPHEAIFIDDRSLNTEAAIALGLRAIHYTGLDKLRTELKELGIEA